MEGADGESFILPVIEKDDLKIANSFSWTMVKRTNENEKGTAVDIDKMVVTTSTVGLRQDDDLHPTHLDRLTGTYLKDDKAICAIPQDDLDHKDEKDRKAILSHPPVVKKEISKEKIPSATKDLEKQEISSETISSATIDLIKKEISSEKISSATKDLVKKEISKEKISSSTKDCFFLICILILLIVTACMTLKLNVSKRLNLQLQEELNQTTGLLNSYRAHQEWIFKNEKVHNKNSFEIETCWLEASFTLGPCSSKPLENLRNAYTNTYEDLASFFGWKTFFPYESNDSATNSFHHDMSTDISLS